MGVLVLGVEAPTVVVKNNDDEVIRLVTDEKLKVPGQATHRRQLLEETIGKQFDFREMAKRSLAGHWKAGMQVSITILSPCFENFFPIPMLGKIENYSGETVNYLKERLKGGYAEVQTSMNSAKTRNFL